MKKILVNLLSNTWLFGTLPKVNKSVYSAAFYEFIYLFIWSILPFALGALVLYASSDAENKSFLSLGISTFRNGELLVFTISMLAPILYLTLHDPERASVFPHKLPISTFVALVIVTSAALFALLKASAVKDFPFVFELSVVLTATALAIRYLALIYHRHRLLAPTESELREPQQEYVHELKTVIAAENSVSNRDFTNQLKAQIGDKS